MQGMRVYAPFPMQTPKRQLGLKDEIRVME